MGTYTTNYNLFMPSIGEQGWGELVNGNFSTIDTTMKSLSNSVTSLDSRLDTVETYGSRITAIENEVNGALSCTSVTTSGTITSTGIINANGGVKGYVTGGIYVNGSYTTSSTSSGIVATTSTQSASVDRHSSGSTGTSSTITVGGYTLSISYPFKLSPGLYLQSASYISGSLPTPSRSVTMTINRGTSGLIGDSKGILYKNGAQVATLGYSSSSPHSASTTVTVSAGDRIYCTATYCVCSISVANASSLYLQAT